MTKKELLYLIRSIKRGYCGLVIHEQHIEAHCMSWHRVIAYVIKVITPYEDKYTNLYIDVPSFTDFENEQWGKLIFDLIKEKSVKTNETIP